MINANGISDLVISRLPRYYRFLGELLAQGKDKIPLKLTVSILRQMVNVHNVMWEKNYIHSFLLYCSTVELNTKYMKRQVLCNQSDKCRFNLIIVKWKFTFVPG